MSTWSLDAGRSATRANPALNGFLRSLARDRPRGHRIDPPTGCRSPDRAADPG